jgi:S1-C subfamily serine protease
VFDFVTTNDIIGGNSGSPVVNAKGEVLGAAFDGNIHSLGGDYGYDGTINRTVVVSTAAATEALQKVYGQTALVKELTAR